MYQDVIDQFTLCFKPIQSIIQSWYQLGNLTSASCKNQIEFMNRLLDIASECAFSNKDEAVKFLFMIHNADTMVKNKLIKSMKPESMLQDILSIDKSVESTIITEKLSKGDSKPQVLVDSVNKQNVVQVREVANTSPNQTVRETPKN